MGPEMGTPYIPRIYLTIPKGPYLELPFGRRDIRHQACCASSLNRRPFTHWSLVENEGIRALYIYIYICVYIYTYIHTYIYLYTYMHYNILYYFKSYYIYIERERDPLRDYIGYLIPSFMQATGLSAPLWSTLDLRQKLLQLYSGIRTL